MKIFLDTNVLASALMGHGLCRDLLDRIVIDHTVLLDEPVREELRRILTGKFRVPVSLWQKLDVRLERFERAPAADIALDVEIPDPDDIPVLAYAAAIPADIIVTGDKALLELQSVKNIPILSPRQIWMKLVNLQD